MHIILINYVYDSAYATLDGLLERYETLTGWAESVLSAGATRVTVIQRYARDAELTRNGVTYLFRADGQRLVPHPLASLRRLHRIAAALQPDLVHVHGMLFPVQIWQLRQALARDTAIIVQDHAGVFATTGRSLKARLRRVVDRVGLGAADAFLFTVDEQAQPWRAAGVIAPHQPVHAIMESSRRLMRMPREQARALSGLRGDPALLWVGRLNANKDPLTVLDGFEQALPQLPGARLAMTYLTDELMPEVQARLARSPALAERVDLLGCLPYDRMSALLSAADLFVLGSHREAGGFALIETMACGAVPVVTDIPSFRAITANGSLGRLWPPGDARALAAALVEMGQRDLTPLRDAMAEHFTRELSWDAIGRRALATYQEVAARR